MRPLHRENEKAGSMTQSTTKATTLPPRSIGHRITSSTAPISPLAVRVFSILSKASRQRCSANSEVVAEGDFVIVHERFSGFAAPVNWIAADTLRIEDGILVEHWDVIQDEASRASSKSGLPMFVDKFGE
jgi:hypothetical protein